jgi:two-component sensor histidine kinase
MLNFTKILIIFLIFHSILAITTELWEKSIEDLKKEFNHRLSIMQEIHEREIEEMKKRISDPNQMFNQINNKLCYSKEFRSGKINESDEELKNQTVVESKSKSFLLVFRLFFQRLFILFFTNFFY